MKMNKCSDCKFSSIHRGHGEYWLYCTFPGSPKAYDNIISNEIIPDFCGLGLSNKGEFIKDNVLPKTDMMNSQVTSEIFQKYLENE